MHDILRSGEHRLCVYIPARIYSVVLLEQLHHCRGDLSMTSPSRQYAPETRGGEQEENLWDAVVLLGGILLFCVMCWVVEIAMLNGMYPDVHCNFWCYIDSMLGAP